MACIGEGYWSRMSEACFIADSKSDGLKIGRADVKRRLREVSIFYLCNIFMPFSARGLIPKRNKIYSLRLSYWRDWNDLPNERTVIGMVNH
jgi:hypothetical protein